MNIGFIAMSGIRVCDAELLELGLTLPGFVERSKTIAALPSLGLLTLAGMTPDRHRVTYLEIDDLRAVEGLPAEFDLVALSTYAPQSAEAYELADRYRQVGTRVVMGGLHVSCVPEEATRHCDAVVIGDGELHWPEVLKDAEARKLKPFYGRRTMAFDLAKAPVPAFELLDISRYNRLTVQVSRGCPHQCEFCASSILLAPSYRQKPVDKVLAEIEKIRGIWDHPFLEFADDNAMAGRPRWKQILSELRNAGIRWFAETDLSVAEDDELLDLMRESGCVQVLIGFESPVETGLNHLERRSNWKLKQWPRYREVIQRIQSHGISVNGCFVIGLDGHGPDIFDRVFDFVKETGLYEVQVTIQTAFPGTPLYERLKLANRLLQPRAWETCTLFDVNFRPDGMSPEELAEGFRNLVVRLYGEEFTTERRRRFRQLLRQQAAARNEEAEGA